ncbi:MAG: class I SAM-dependent methyltransferase [Gemmatimonadales bacterium]
MTGDDYSFKAFSEQPFYQAVNERLVESAHLKPGWRVVDAACGTGSVTSLVAERIRGARDALVVGLDRSKAALEEARARLADTRDAVVQFVEGQAEQMSQAIKGAADAVFLANCVHYFENKSELIAEARRTLRPGGVFAFNTTFFEGAVLKETERFYRRWMLRALRMLKERHDLKPSREKTQARQQLNAEEYRELLESNGFLVSVLDLVPVSVVEQGWIDICRYADFIAGVMPGVPVDCASDVLCQALRATFEELQLESVPRNWLTVVAQRA